MKLRSLLVTLFMRKGGVEILNKLYLHESKILKYEMMPIKGLQPEEVVLPKQALAAKGGIYFSSVLLCMWDNIHGPSVLMVWTGPRAVEGASHEGRPVAGGSLVHTSKAWHSINRSIRTGFGSVPGQRFASDANFSFVAPSSEEL